MFFYGGCDKNKKLPFSKAVFLLKLQFYCLIQLSCNTFTPVLQL
jgi:hypothetical protein